MWGFAGRFNGCPGKQRWNNPLHQFVFYNRIPLIVCWCEVFVAYSGSISDLGIKRFLNKCNLLAYMLGFCQLSPKTILFFLLHPRLSTRQRYPASPLFPSAYHYHFTPTHTRHWTYHDGTKRLNKNTPHPPCLSFCMAHTSPIQ